MATAPFNRSGMKNKHQRLVLIIIAVVAMVGAVLLAMSALKDQAAYFYSPGQALAAKVEPGRAIRLGGMVVPGSVKREADGVTLRFAVKDADAQVPVTFAGIVPDLFKENSVAISEGAFDATGTFRATNVLAKHDENYMPREMQGVSYDSKTHKVSKTGQ